MKSQENMRREQTERTIKQGLLLGLAVLGILAVVAVGGLVMKNMDQAGSPPAQVAVTSEEKKSVPAFMPVVPKDAPPGNPPELRELPPRREGNQQAPERINIENIAKFGKGTLPKRRMPPEIGTEVEEFLQELLDANLRPSRNLAGIQQVEAFLGEKYATEGLSQEKQKQLTAYLGLVTFRTSQGQLERKGDELYVFRDKESLNLSKLVADFAKERTVGGLSKPLAAFGLK